MSDESLIKGAYAAAGGGIKDKGLAAAKGMTKIADTIAKPVAEELGERRDKFNEFVEWEMNRQPGLNDANYDARIDDLMEMKADYMWGDNASRAKIMRHMGDMKAQQEALEGAITDLANSGDNDVDGLENTFKQSPEAQSIADAAKNGKWAWVDGQYKLATEQDGQTVYYSEGDLNRLNQEFSFDQSSKNVFDAYIENTLKSAEESDPYNYVDFDYEAERGKVANIVNKGSVKSMALSDKFIPGRVFRDDLISSLKEGSYGDLGVDVSHIQNVDPDSDGDGVEFISDDDATAIADALINDNDLAKEYLTEYFTIHTEKNWEKSQLRNKRHLSTLNTQVNDVNKLIGGLSEESITVDLELPAGGAINEFDRFGNRIENKKPIKEMSVAELENARDILAGSYGPETDTPSLMQKNIDRLILLMDQRENELNKTISPDQI